MQITDNEHWNSEPEVGAYLAALIKMTRASHVLEVGYFKGRTTQQILNALPHPGLYHGVDIIEAPQVKEPKGRIVEFYQGDSKEMLKELNKSFYDLVFVDSEHHWDHILPEFKAVEQLVVPGGVIAYHDSIHIADVKRLMEYAKQWRYNAVTLNTTEGRGLTLLQRL
jgi:predicted O-methyltransferase YrrM